MISNTETLRLPQTIVAGDGCDSRAQHGEAKLVRAYLLVTGARSKAKEIKYAAKRLRCVREVHQLEGPYDLLILLQAPQNEDLHETAGALSTLDDDIRVTLVPCEGEV